MRYMHFIKSLKAPTVFLVVGTVVGGLVVFLLPPLFGNDEIVHFPRAYQISQGQLWEDRLTDHDYGGQVPTQLKEFNDGFRELVQAQTTDKDRLRALMEKYRHEKIEGDQSTELAFTSAGVYAPWSYLPSAIGVGVADLLNLPLIWYVWLGRMMSLLMWIGLTYWALRLLPAGKFFMVAIALLPTSLVQATNLGMDGVVNGISWVIIAMTFAVVAGKLRFTMPRILLLIGLCFFLATTKQGYLPIALLPLIIPAKQYLTRKKWVNVGRVVFATLLIATSIFYISKMIPLTSVLHFTQRPGINVDSHAQILFIAENPIKVLYIIFVQPFMTYSGGVWAGTVGVITNKMLYLPVVVVGMLYASLVITFIMQRKTFRFAGQYAKRVGWGCLAVGLATFVLINLALYVAFTTVAHPYVEGLQGRYFLPFAPLAVGFVNLWPSRWRWSLPKWAYLVVAVGIGAGLTSALIRIAQLL